MNSAHIQTALNRVVALFEKPNVLQDYITQSTTSKFFPKVSKPSDSWSLCNKILMYLSETIDARGFKQWKKVGRNVKKGCKAIYILAPKKHFIGVHEDGEKVYALSGFKAIPVFRYEDTEGKELNRKENEVIQNLPFIHVASKWGISVEPLMEGGKVCPHYIHRKTGEESIWLNSPSVRTFLHELAHAAHRRVLKDYDARSETDDVRAEEIAVELSAATLCELIGVEPNHQPTLDYVKAWAGGDEKNILSECTKVLHLVEKITDLILSESETEG